jgi:succinate-acetate transporter protein
VNALILGLIGGLINIISDFALVTIIFAGLIVIDPFVTISTAIFFGGTALVLNKLLHVRAKEIGKEISKHTIEVNSILKWRY